MDRLCQACKLGQALARQSLDFTQVACFLCAQSISHNDTLSHSSGAVIGVFPLFTGNNANSKSLFDSVRELDTVCDDDHEPYENFGPEGLFGEFCCPLVLKESQTWISGSINV